MFCYHGAWQFKMVTTWSFQQLHLSSRSYWDFISWGRCRSKYRNVLPWGRCKSKYWNFIPWGRCRSKLLFWAGPYTQGGDVPPKPVPGHHRLNFCNPDEMQLWLVLTRLWIRYTLTGLKRDDNTKIEVRELHPPPPSFEAGAMLPLSAVPCRSSACLSL